MKFTPMFTIPLCITSLALAGCDAPELETHSDPQPEMLQVVAIDGAEAVDVSISEEEFARMAEEYGLPLHDDADDADGITPRLSSACSIPPSVSNSGATWSSSATKSPSCYGYVRFGGDTEDDCYIKFANYTKKSGYKFNDLNLCADAAATYYGNNFAAYYDTNANVYLRMDRKWCAYSDCEDGFKIQ